MSLVFLVGGARSGKSTVAVQLAQAWEGTVTVIATGEARDPEMAARIQSHRDLRPATWTTVEEPLDLTGTLVRVPGESAVIVECVSLWVANVLERGDSIAEVEAESARAAGVASARSALTIAVSNEVGLGIVPTTPLGRTYRDLLGRVNSVWAAAADRSALIVAGRALPLASAELLL